MLDLSKQKLLVIAPHPDDEVIGCGGLIKKIKDARGKVYVLFLTVGDTQDFSKKGLSKASERQKEIEKVARFLKFDDYHVAFKGNNYHLKLDLLGQNELMHMIERESPVSLQKVKPTIVALPSVNSYNQDHRVTAEATHAALRPAPPDNKHSVETVLEYEEPADSWTLNPKIEPIFFVPLSKSQLDAKIKALKLYKSQLRPHPNTRSSETLKALAILRGSMCGSLYGEGFKLYRGILK